MRIIKATVTTNSEDDPYMRVKVKSPSIWKEESELLSSLNSIYLEKGDIVLVWYETLANPIILGKYHTFERETPVEGQEFFSAKKDDKWIIGTLFSEELAIQSSEGYKVLGFFDSLIIETPNGSKFSLKDDNFSALLSNGINLTLDDNVLINSSNGKISIVNSVTDSLFQILDKLVTTLSTNQPTTQGSPTAQVFNPTILADLQALKVKIGLLLE